MTVLVFFYYLPNVNYEGAAFIYFFFFFTLPVEKDIVQMKAGSQAKAQEI